MTTQLFMQLFSIAAAGLAIGVAIYAIRSNIKTRRAIDEQRKLLAAAEAKKKTEREQARQVMALLGALSGQTPVEPVAVKDIKHRDEVCWHSADGSRHEHYQAGYDGDPGPSKDGLHARPLTPGGL
ncbi:hypothetical protein [Brevibacterium casei]|uniref:hypothetical protein n=1 Tax=Brevibacterium casei TaxID=33889 RepID=UPI00241CC798|nr:hypothetical protein [Brevibacterium casei]